jgi:hypothetical protein
MKVLYFDKIDKIYGVSLAKATIRAFTYLEEDSNE